MTIKYIHSLLIATTAFVFISMGYLFYLGYRLSVEHAPLVDAAMEIKLEATTAHLWFEEIISGDETITIESVWGHIEKADWYAEAMLSGGQNSEGKFFPLKDEVARNSIYSVKKQLANFRAIAEERYNEKDLSKPGSDVDQRFDNVFNDFISKSDNVETRVQQIIKTQQTRFFYIGIFLLLTSMITAFIMLRIIIRNNRSKITLLDSLNDANIKLQNNEKYLEKKVGERTRELIKAKNLAEASSRSKSEFLASMSHELKTPLNSVIGFSELLEHYDNLNDEQKDYLNEIKESGKKLSGLVSAILELSSIDSDEEIQKQQISLRELVYQSVSEHEPVCKDRKVKVKYLIKEDISLVTDYQKLKKCIDNLISNAINYNTENGQVEITISQNDYIEISVRDSGIGISQKDCEKIFDAFERLKFGKEGTISGSGVGLTITKKIIESLGGEIIVNSDLVKGSNFTLRLPKY